MDATWTGQREAERIGGQGVHDWTKRVVRKVHVETNAGPIGVSSDDRTRRFDILKLNTAESFSWRALRVYFIEL